MFLLMLIFIVWVGVGGRSGAVYAFLLAAGMNFFAYCSATEWSWPCIERKQVTANEAPELYGMVAELTSKAGVPMPKVYIMENDTPNAFATGRNPEHAAVAVTTGSQDPVTDELMGVIGHAALTCQTP